MLSPLYTFPDCLILYKIKGNSTFFTKKYLYILSPDQAIRMNIPLFIIFVLIMQECNYFSSTKFVIGKDIHFTFVKK